ncbi:putative toxin-antitoxin system toxin component, PIN family [Candidatus Gottesmanbacteria bacterium]|nr:putative toxin-antitoxin system toxin component, PIN family [Candidatus Gottesmanbacteria bacterium]
MQSLENNSIKVIPVTNITLCRDPKDNEILALAIDGAASYIITGDRDLLTLGKVRGVTIVNPIELLQIMISRKK